MSATVQGYSYNVGYAQPMRHCGGSAPVRPASPGGYGSPDVTALLGSVLQSLSQLGSAWGGFSGRSPLRFAADPNFGNPLRFAGNPFSGPSPLQFINSPFFSSRFPIAPDGNIGAGFLAPDGNIGAGFLAPDGNIGAGFLAPNGNIGAGFLAPDGNLGARFQTGNILGPFQTPLRFF